MKKNDFKKLAILGIVSGTVMSAQVNAAPVLDASTSGTFLAGGCGGSSSNGGGGGCHSNSRPANSCNAAPQYYQGSSQTQAPQASCSQPRFSNGCGASPKRSNGYTADAYTSTTNQMPQSSCSGAQHTMAPQGSCGGARQVQAQPGQMMQQPSQTPGQMMQQPGQMMQQTAPAVVQPGQSAGYNQSSRQQPSRYVSEAQRPGTQQPIMSEEERAMQRQNPDAAKRMNPSTPKQY